MQLEPNQIHHSPCNSQSARYSLCLAGFAVACGRLLGGIGEGSLTLKCAHNRWNARPLCHDVIHKAMSTMRPTEQQCTSAQTVHPPSPRARLPPDRAPFTTSLKSLTRPRHWIDLYQPASPVAHQSCNDQSPVASWLAWWCIVTWWWWWLAWWCIVTCSWPSVGSPRAPWEMEMEMRATRSDYARIEEQEERTSRTCAGMIGPCTHYTHKHAASSATLAQTR